MKCAIIAPHSMLELCKTDYHLVLPQEVERYGSESAYVEFYKAADGYVILDNGAAEGYAPPGPYEYHKMARFIDADELVVPDVIGDAEKTAQLATAFSKQALPDEFNYMGVLQGSTLEEALHSLMFWAKQEWVSTIAIPRHLCKKMGDDIRLHLARIIQLETRFKKENIHCLGGCSWVEEIHALARQDLVRGMDTSLPINMGLAGRTLDEPIVKRPVHYFGVNIPRNSFVWERIVSNVKQYIGWAYDPFGPATTEEAS